MARFKLIEVTKTEVKESQSIYDYSDLQDATTAMHNDFGVALKQQATLSVYCVIVDNETSQCMGICTYPRILGDYTSTGESTEKYAIRQRIYTHNDYTEDDLLPYDTEQLAIGNFHTNLADARSNPNCEHAIIVRLTKTGEFADNYCYYKNPPVPENSVE